MHALGLFVGLACWGFLGACTHNPNTTYKCDTIWDCREVPVERPTPSKPCKESCVADGRCGGSPGRCVAISQEDCRRSKGCEGHGACTKVGKACLPTQHAHCAASRACAQNAKCAVGTRGKCVPASTTHCTQSLLCANSGRCTYGDLRDGSKGCIVGSIEDCKKTKKCKEEGRCKGRLIRREIRCNHIK